jgi:1,6-anhydro-N-acetylmuramate kinase
MDNRDQDTRLAVGVMTGTSIDGIDAALVRVEGRARGIRVTLLRHLSESLGDMQPRLRAAAEQRPMTAGEFARLAWDFGELHVATIVRLVESAIPNLICVHGQTVFHQPPVSLQLINPAPIAARFDCPIVSDLRQADLAHGGQGAPITPLADWILFRDRENPTSRAIVNLGGFCNVTILPRSCAGTTPSPPAGGNPPNAAALDEDVRGIRGFDVCACNQLLDAIARDTLGVPFDEDGAAALRGRANPQATEALCAILEQQRQSAAQRRSLGTGDEALAWLRDNRSTLAPNDLAASSVQAIALTIRASLMSHSIDQVVLAGGGARNLALRVALQMQAAVLDTSSFGIPIDAREAACFAILGALCQDGVPISLPAVTGCREPAPPSGTWAGVRP